MTRFTYRQRLALQALVELGRKHGVSFVGREDGTVVLYVDDEQVHDDLMSAGAARTQWPDRLERRLSS